MEGFGIGLTLGVVLGVLVGAAMMDESWEEDCVKNNVGYYNPADGKFMLVVNPTPPSHVAK